MPAASQALNPVRGSVALEDWLPGSTAAVAPVAVAVEDELVDDGLDACVVGTGDAAVELEEAGAEPEDAGVELEDDGVELPEPVDEDTGGDEVVLDWGELVLDPLSGSTYC